MIDTGGKKRYPSQNFHYLSHNAVLPPEVLNSYQLRRNRVLEANSRNFNDVNRTLDFSNEPIAGKQSGILEKPHHSLNQTINVHGMVASQPFSNRVPQYERSFQERTY